MKKTPTYFTPPCPTRIVSVRIADVTQNQSFELSSHDEEIRAVLTAFYTKKPYSTKQMAPLMEITNVPFSLPREICYRVSCDILNILPNRYFNLLQLCP